MCRHEKAQDWGFKMIQLCQPWKRLRWSKKRNAMEKQSYSQERGNFWLSFCISAEKGKKNCLKGFESSNENCEQCSASVPKPGKWQISPAICSCLRSQHLHPLQFFLVALEPSWKMRGWTSENRIGARKCSWKGWPVQDYAFDWVIVSLDKSEQSCNKPR